MLEVWWQNFPLFSGPVPSRAAAPPASYNNRDQKSEVVACVYIPALGSLRQEDFCDFKASLSYIVRWRPA